MDKQPTNQQPRKRGDVEMDRGTYTPRNQQLTTPGEASNPPAGEQTKLNSVCKCGAPFHMPPIYSDASQDKRFALNLCESCWDRLQSDFKKQSNPDHPTIKPGLQVQGAESVAYLIQSPDRSKSETWTSTQIEEYDPLPAYRENGWHVIPLFPDQSAEIAELRERNNWLEGQREIAIQERDNAHNESRELLSEIKRLRAEVEIYHRQCVDDQSLKGLKIEYRNEDNRYYVYDKDGGFLWSGEPFFNAWRCALQDAELKQLRERVKALEVENESLKSNQALGINSNHAQ